MTRNPEARKNATAGRYWLPTIPYTLVDAVNRAAAATGSVRYAMAAGNADYNGHSVTVYYNDYRGYYLCEHYFGERVVHARGSMEDALRAGAAEYKLGHRGTVVTTCELTAEEAALATTLGYVPCTKEAQDAHEATWYSDLHACVGEALGDARWGGDTVHLLLKAKDARDYHTMKELMHAKQCGCEKVCKIIGLAGEQGMVVSGTHRANGEAWAFVSVDGKSVMSGPVASARAWWREQVAKGWKP